MNMNLNFYTGEENEVATFYQLPKALIKNPAFIKLSNNAKILYTLMVDRVSLSKSNNWTLDGKIYVYFTHEEACKMLNISKRTAVKIFKELEENLIENKKQGLNRPNIIFMRNMVDLGLEKGESYKFSSAHASKEKELKKENKKLKETVKKLQMKLNELTGLTLQEEDVENFVTEEQIKKTCPEVQKMHHQKCKKNTSRNAEKTLQEVQNMHPINTNTIKTNIIETNNINSFNENIENFERDDNNNYNNNNNYYLTEEETSYEYINENNVTEETSYDKLKNKNQLKKAIEELIEFDLNKKLSKGKSEYFSGLKIFRNALNKMLTEKEMYLNNMHVTRSNVYEKVKENLEINYKGNTCLNTLVENSLNDFTNGMQKTNVKYPVNYMCSCIWNALLYGDINDYTNTSFI